MRALPLLLLLLFSAILSAFGQFVTRTVTGPLVRYQDWAPGGHRNWGGRRIPRSKRAATVIVVDHKVPAKDTAIFPHSEYQIPVDMSFKRTLGSRMAVKERANDVAHQNKDKPSIHGQYTGYMCGPVDTPKDLAGERGRTPMLSSAIPLLHPHGEARLTGQDYHKHSGEFPTASAQRPQSNEPVKKVERQLEDMAIRPPELGSIVYIPFYMTEEDRLKWMAEREGRN